jgi:dolichol-phosphate mannosyltransferase
MMQPTYSIVIPCHNEAATIGALLRRVQKEFHGTCHEVIVVLDGCSDTSVAVVHAIAQSMPSLFTIEHKQKLGKGGAIRRGFSHAKGIFIGFIDGDNEIDPQYLHEAFRVLEQKKCHIVIGNRYCTGAAYHTTIARHVTSRIYQTVIWMLFGLGISDSQAGMKVFTSSVGKQLFTTSNINGYAFDIDVLVHAHWLGYDIVDIPMQQRFKGTSSITHSHVFEMIADTCRTYDRHAREIIRLRGMHPSVSRIDMARSMLLFPFTTALEYGLRRYILHLK